MTGYAKEFAHHDPDYLRAIRDVNAGELFDGQQVSQVIVNTAEIVNAVSIRNVSMPRLALGHLFSATMMKPNVRNRLNDVLAI